MISLQCDDEASACRAYADAQELFARQVSSKDGASQTISAAALALFCGLLAYHPGNVDRNFRADHPDQLWVADITYIPTWSGFLYLAIVLDVFSRRVVGWAMANYLRTELVLEALDMAIFRRRALLLRSGTKSAVSGRFGVSPAAVQRHRSICLGHKPRKSDPAKNSVAAESSGSVRFENGRCQKCGTVLDDPSPKALVKRAERVLYFRRIDHAGGGGHRRLAPRLDGRRSRSSVTQSVAQSSRAIAARRSGQRQRRRAKAGRSSSREPGRRRVESARRRRR